MATQGVFVTVIAVIVTVALGSSSVQGKNYKFTSSCFQSPTRTLDMSCRKGEMLRIARAFYGYSPSGSCSFSPDDCTFNEHQNYACVGRQTCSINMPGGFGRPIPGCKHGEHDSSYFQVEYECIPAEQTVNICKPEVSTMSGQSGYISSPAYPLNYDQPHQCTITIDMPSSKGVRLFIVDMNLRELEQGRGCNDFLYISNALSSVTVCGQRGSEELFDSRTGKIDITFSAKTGGNNKGFWLYYEVYPPMDATTTTTPKPTSTLKTLLNKLSDKTTGETPIVENEVRIEHQQTQPGGQPESETDPTPSPNSDNVPFAAIVGGVIGTLCFILTILLILLVIQRIKEKRDLEKKKHLPFLDVRNQAFQSNSELCPQDSNYC